jgi:hypothetical protein
VITIEREHLEGDPVSEEIRILSSLENLVRRIWKGDTGSTILDITYEYDSNENCISGIALDKDHNVVCFIENTYTNPGRLSAL